MTSFILAQAAPKPEVFSSISFFNIGSIVAICLYVFIFALIIVGLMRLVRYLGSARKEQQLMRMEITKIAGEVELLRKKLTEVFPHQNNAE